ncbi:MAG: hypothetical protein ACJ8E3_08245 [Sphingomicrobium sp.]
MVSDETFFAWLDGELDGENAARVAAEVEADPGLSQRAQRHRAMQARVKGAFDGLLTAPVPSSLEDAVRGRSNVVDLNDARRSVAPRPRLPQWAAIAATLAVGVVAGTMVPRQADTPVALRDGNIYAAAALDDALDAELASAPSGNVRIGLTFRDPSGAICRTFVEPAASGLACRSGDKWQVRGLFAAPEGQSGGYRMAAGIDPNLAALVGSTMASEPFDAAQERAARDKSWR